MSHDEKEFIPAGEAPHKPLELKRGSLGFLQLVGRDIAFVGGLPCLPRGRGGRMQFGMRLQGPPGTSRLRFFIYDLEMMRQGKTQDEAEVGTADINLRLVGDPPDIDGSIEGLVLLEAKKSLRRTGLGIGRRSVEALLASAPEGLHVYDIKKSAVGFWRKMGCEIEKTNRAGARLDGIIRSHCEPELEPGTTSPAPV